MIDLENFPTRETAKDMMGMISPIYDKAYVAKWLFEVMSVPLALAQETVYDLKNQAFPETATWTLTYWEQSYRIPTNEALSIEERRRQIISKRNYRKPMNPARIELMLQEVSGRQVKLIENIARSTFGIEIQDGDEALDISKIIDVIKSVKQSQKSVRIYVTKNQSVHAYYGIHMSLASNYAIMCEELNCLRLKQFVGISYRAVANITLN